MQVGRLASVAILLLPMLGALLVILLPDLCPGPAPRPHAAVCEFEPVAGGRPGERTRR